MRTLRAVQALAAVVLAAFPAAAGAAPGDGMFRSPSGAIGCAYYDGVLRCDVDGGVKPLPARPARCDLDWGAGFWLKQRGGATVVCAGDTARDPNSRVIPYGATWHGGGIVCGSTPNGMRCSNADRHGFLISRGEAYRF